MSSKRIMYRQLREQRWGRIQAFIIAFGFAFGPLGRLTGWKKEN